MNNSSSSFPVAEAAFQYGLSEAELNLYGLPYGSQAELARIWEKARKASRTKARK